MDPAIDSGGTRLTTSGFPDVRLHFEAASAPDEPSIADEDGDWISRAGLLNAVTGLVGELRDRGVRRGDVVSLWMAATWRASAAYLATTRLGAIAHPMSVRSSAAEAEAMLRQVRPKVVVIHAESGDGEATKAMSDCVRASSPSSRQLSGESIVVSSSPSRPVAADVEADESRSPSDPCVLIFTSGSSGEPRGLVHSYASMHSITQGIASRMRLRERDTISIAAPVGHVRWIHNGAILPFTLPASLIVAERWNPHAWVESANRLACRAATFSPKQIADLIACEREGLALTSLEVVMSGGSYISSQLVRAAEETLGITVVRCYGSTEFPVAVSGAVDDGADERAQLDGRALPGVEVRIDAEASTSSAAMRIGVSEDQDSPPAVGRICLRGDHAAVANWLADEHRPEPIDPDEWVQTDDYGLMVDGFLQVLGKEASTIVKNGENISAPELEELLQDFPGLDDVAVVGRNDEVAGQRVCVVAVPSADVEVSLDALKVFLLAQGASRVKLPDELIVMRTIPRTSIGKVRRGDLWRAVNAESATARAAGFDSDATETTTLTVDGRSSPIPSTMRTHP